MKSKLTRYIALALGLSTLISCENLLEIDDPLNEVPSEVIFRSEDMAKSALSGAYSGMSTNATFNQSITQFNAFSAAEVDFMGGATFLDFMQNTYDPIVTTRLSSVWTDTYQAIYRFNNIIEQLVNNDAISLASAQRMMNEARVMRVYCYFHLVNMFGDVPLVTTTDASITATLPRTPTQEIYQWMVQELEQAKELLSNDYPSANRNQVNKFAAHALLARIYLHTGNYDLAEKNATAVIDHTALYGLLPKEELEKVFLRDSREAILQLGPAVMNTNAYTVEGSTFVPSNTATVANYELTSSLLESFEAGDQRRVKWIKESNYSTKQTFQPFKYQNYNQTVAVSSGRTEVPMLLRLAEQYLIRAEARFRSDNPNLTGARSDLNVIRNRAGLDDLTAGADFEQALLKERYTEYFCENGDRWYTIKRTGAANTIMGALRSTTWRTEAQLYPIPQPARDTNPFLSQNDGYR